MTTGIGGLMLHLWVIAGGTLIVTALLTTMARRYLLSILSCFGPAARQRFVWFIAALPWMLGLIAALLTLVPSVGHALGVVADHCHTHGNLHGHLCWFHPPEFVWISWKGLCAVMLIGITAWKATTSSIRLWKQRNHLRALLAFADRESDGSYILDSKIPSAFTAGLVAPKILLSKSLVTALNEQELRIVQRHEQVHQQRRDPLKLWIFNLLISVFLPAARRDLYNALELSMEQTVDAEVAKFDDPATVATTLVKVNRLNLRYLKQQHADAAMCSFVAAAVEERIQQLLKTNKGRRFPWGSFLVSLAIVMAAAVYYADGLHHVVETFLHNHP
ncbi:M56 family metallopeptidase [Cellvibrio sp. QJXJ]|uniref:M56 family metallopeptidase n=1 Tax=Cellvibrio sp. QJXJ TaxID=2964606 RepID=UPI0021C31A44|nr:M56 family metallopeptidase [Cellvibrio sp. QJXJ]UUA72078.1 M48 family metalloprotease [Cellvibrio sp. QJXJ]